MRSADPYRTVHGALYDSGNYQAALERALELADYAGWRAKRRAIRFSVLASPPLWKYPGAPSVQQDLASHRMPPRCGSDEMGLFWCRAEWRITDRGTLLPSPRLPPRPLICLAHRSRCIGMQVSGCSITLRKEMIAPTRILPGITRSAALGRRKRTANFQASDVNLQFREKQAYNQARSNQQNEFSREDMLL